MNSASRLEQLLEVRRQRGQTLTLVTGVFDVLHPEHQQFLAKAKVLADLLVVGLESDLRVRQLKGQDRPANSATQRSSNLKKWGLADHIFVLPEDFAQAQVRQHLLEQLQPDFLAVSSNTPFLEVKQKMMATIGGQVVVVHQFNPQISSSQLIANRQLKDQAKHGKLTENYKKREDG